MSAEQVAEITQHDDMVALSGLIPTGSPEALPNATAQRTCGRHQNGWLLQVHLLTGVSAGAAADDALSAADAISWRASYQTSSGLREKINQDQMRLVDLHLGEVVQMINYDFFGKIGVAVIETSAITSDGRIWLSSGIGNTPARLLQAKKVIIELNYYHNLRAAESADIVMPGILPRHSNVPIFHTMDRADNRCVQIDPKKVVTVVDTKLPGAGNAAGKTSPVNRQIADNVVTFLLAEMAHKHIPAKLLSLQSGVDNINNMVMARLGENPDIPLFMMYSEVLQESVTHPLKTGEITDTSVSSLIISAPSLQKIYNNMDFFASRIMLRPQEIPNNPEIIRRLGITALNISLESDTYGHANPAYIAGVNLMNGIDGSGDFECNACLSIFMAPSIVKGGRISTVVPMCSHADHSEYSVKVIVIE